MKEKIQRAVSIQNRRARFDYELLDTYTAGMVLVGTEIKSLRLGKASLVDAFCYFHNGELWLKGANISESTARTTITRHAVTASSSSIARSFASSRLMYKALV